MPIDGKLSCRRFSPETITAASKLDNVTTKVAPHPQPRDQ
jgi:hypothetical protein